ncbi:nitroreductase family protein [Anaeromicropila herbilytica]|uniref:Nitroreductase n=1 Tax=Anaeromicropila herbilytica TaxID=2785025 RepID=A0A7R7EHF3_9FIRM|nr:nitroreductase family protein [Anaeromicropila herbilytica]BCN28901.1 nitroreductase [Anaeromicropila herbilytica]
MEMMKVITMRKSTRSYKIAQISDEALNKIINSGCAAPVGNGAYDTVHLSVIQDYDYLNKISKTAANIFGNPDANPLYGAPTLIIVSGLPNKQIPNVELANAACIIENMSLAATDEGIGSVYILGAIAAFHADKELLNALNLPDGFIPVSGVALGYPTEPLTQEREVKRNITVHTMK